MDQVLTDLLLQAFTHRYNLKTSTIERKFVYCEIGTEYLHIIFLGTAETRVRSRASRRAVDALRRLMVSVEIVVYSVEVVFWLMAFYCMVIFAVLPSTSVTDVSYEL